MISDRIVKLLTQIMASQTKVWNRTHKVCKQNTHIAEMHCTTAPSILHSSCGNTKATRISHVIPEVSASCTVTSNKIKGFFTCFLTLEPFC